MQRKLFQLFLELLCVGDLHLESLSKTGGNLNNSSPNWGPKNVDDHVDDGISPVIKLFKETGDIFIKYKIGCPEYKCTFI